MHGRGAGPERAGVVEHLGRGAPVGGQAGLVLGPLLGQVRVQRRAVPVRPGDHRRASGPAGRRAPSGSRRRPAPAGRAGRARPRRAPRPGPPTPRRRRRRTAAGCRPAAAAGRPGPARRTGSRCPAGVIRIPAWPAASISGPAHLVRVRVRDAVRAVVQVVELADAGDARPAPSRRRRRGPGPGSCPGRGRPPPGTSAPARSRTCPGPAWVIPRSARWNACECAFARPGRVRPGSRVVRRAGRRSRRRVPRA